MNVCVIAAMAFAFFFPKPNNAGYVGVAASWGFVVSGALQLGLLMRSAHRLGLWSVSRACAGRGSRSFSRALVPR